MHQTKKCRQNIERKTTTVSTSEGTAVLARGPFPFPSFPFGLCVPGGMGGLGGCLDRAPASSGAAAGLWERDGGTEESFSAPLLRPDSYHNQVSLHLRR